MKPRLPKIALFIAALLFVAATASNIQYQNPSDQRCSQPQKLDACQQYLIQSSKSIQNSDWREEFMRCCPELEKVEENCRCESIRMTAERVEKRGELKGDEEMEEMYLTAQTLPALCGNMPPRRCSFQSPFFLTY